MAYVPLETVKAYARIDYEDEDALLSSLIDAAERYLTNAGVDAGSSPRSLYHLAVCGIVLHWYGDRSVGGESTSPDFPPGIRAVINQLKLTCGVLSSLDNC